MDDGGDALDYNEDYSPTATLSPEDPLRAWAKHLEEDPTWTHRFLVDRKGAIDEMVARGVPPPPMNSFVDASGLPDSALVGQPVPGSPGATILSVSRGPVTNAQTGAPMPVDMNNLPGFPKKKPVAAAEAPAPEPEEDTSSGDALEPTAGLPRARPKEAGPSAAELKQQKAAGVESGLGDFAKMMAGVKPVPPPPLNAVGTPGVRSATPLNPASIAQIMQLFGQTPTPGAINTLGRLLVAGKA